MFVGIIVGIDFVLVMIEEDCGVEIFKVIVCDLVVYYCCSGGQLQFLIMFDLELILGWICDVLVYVCVYFKEQFLVEWLVEVVNISLWQFVCQFIVEIGEIFVCVIECLCCEVVLLCIEEFRELLEQIVRQVGFDMECMWCVCLCIYGLLFQVLCWCSCGLNNQYFGVVV